MIDWYSVAVNALWILGLSILLAAFSYHDWLRRETGRRWKEVSAGPSWRLPFSGGTLLFCLGMGLRRDTAWWERTVWGVLTLWFTWQLIEVYRDARRFRQDQAERDSDQTLAVLPSISPREREVR